MLEATHALVAALKAQLDAFCAPITHNPDARVILAGAGTSAYIGQILAPLLDRHWPPAWTQWPPPIWSACAPQLHLDATQPLLLVSFGRSGNSPESLAAVTLVEQQVDVARHLIVTCNPEGKLGKLQLRQAMTLQLPEATHDASFAMTSSFSCMLSATLAALSPNRYRMPATPLWPRPPRAR